MKRLRCKKVVICPELYYNRRYSKEDHNGRRQAHSKTDDREKIMKKTIAAILCVLLISVLAAGCGAKPRGSGGEEAKALRSELAGNWSQITEDGTPSLPEMGIPSGYVFYQDGTGLDTFWNMSFHYTVEDDNLHIAYDDSLGEEWDYRYEIKGDKLTLTRLDNDAITMVYQRETEETTIEETTAAAPPTEDTPPAEEW